MNFFNRSGNGSFGPGNFNAPRHQKPCFSRTVKCASTGPGINTTGMLGKGIADGAWQLAKVAGAIGAVGTVVYPLFSLSTKSDIMMHMLDGTDKRLDRMETDLTEIKMTLLVGVDARLDCVDARLDRIDARLERMEKDTAEMVMMLHKLCGKYGI